MKALSILSLLFLALSLSSPAAKAGTDLQCVRQNLTRCLVHFDRPTCARLLRQACVVGPHWNRRCVQKHASRCFLALLTRVQCKRKLAPLCYRP
ncbi:MAG: hypothetical protein HN509_16460 [Halobacteriovoraceae bacterium]|jgi:hypothetical protein|nr:hypothetical protein [Halobacteriovoraceae bacterium]MBT5094603.1 hypothetical protein [Halobacteriovoraceae bacterium]